MFKCLDDQEASLGGTREHKKTDGAGGRKKVKQDSDAKTIVNSHYKLNPSIYVRRYTIVKYLFLRYQASLFLFKHI